MVEEISAFVNVCMLRFFVNSLFVGVRGALRVVRVGEAVYFWGRICCPSIVFVVIWEGLFAMDAVVRL